MCNTSMTVSVRHPTDPDNSTRSEGRSSGGTKYRAELEQEWHAKIAQLGIKISDGVSMMKIMEDPVVTKTWTVAQLPSDNLSIENAIILFTSRRWPLMIDP